MYELSYGVGFGQPLVFDVLFYKLEIKNPEKNELFTSLFWS